MTRRFAFSALAATGLTATILTATILAATAVAQPSAAQPPEAPPDTNILRMISRVDPETDPILATIRSAVSPDEEQMASILDLYQTLREEQQKAFFENMLQRMAEKKETDGEGSDHGGAAGDAIMTEVFERIGEANRTFLDSTRSLLSAEQHPLWDACADDLQLQPLGNLPPGMGGNIDRAKEGPEVGAPAPSFRLADVEGRVVTLESLHGKPVVLEFGSLSCPMFRGKVDPFRDLVEEFGDRVHWVVVYTREAHAAGTPRQAAVNPVVGIEIPEHATFAERVASAVRSANELALSRTVLVDDFDDSVTKTYGGFPNWGFILDAEGNLVVRQVWSDPLQVRRTLRKLLGESG